MKICKYLFAFMSLNQPVSLSVFCGIWSAYTEISSCSSFILNHLIALFKEHADIEVVIHC